MQGGVGGGALYMRSRYIFNTLVLPCGTIQFYSEVVVECKT